MFAIVAEIATFNGNPLLCHNIFAKPWRIFAIFVIVCICWRKCTIKTRVKIFSIPLRLGPGLAYHLVWGWDWHTIETVAGIGTPSALALHWHTIETRFGNSIPRRLGIWSTYWRLELASTYHWHYGWDKHTKETGIGVNILGLGLAYHWDWGWDWHTIETGVEVDIPLWLVLGLEARNLINIPLRLELASTYHWLCGWDKHTKETGIGVNILGLGLAYHWDWGWDWHILETGAGIGIPLGLGLGLAYHWE